MAEERARDSRYAYNQYANLVLKTDRSQLPRSEPTGEAQSLVGRIQPGEFGSRAKPLPKSNNNAALNQRDIPKKRTASNRSSLLLGMKRSLLSQQTLQRYTPQTQESKEAYTLLITSFAQLIPNASEDVYISLVEGMIPLLRQEGNALLTVHKELEAMVETTLSHEQVNQWIQLAKQLSDFELNQEQEETFLEESGVAVVFGDEDAAEELMIESDESDAVPEQEDQENENNENMQWNEIETLQKEHSITTKESKLSVTNVDAFWLQRQLSLAFPQRDPTELYALSNEIFQTMQTYLNVPRELENSLVQALDFQHFDLVKQWVRERYLIVWSMLWKRLSSEEEKVALIERIKEAGSESIMILAQLQGKAASESVQENGNNNALNQSTISLPSANAMLQEMESNTLEELDLESLQFSQKSHVMTHRYCRLPDNATRTVAAGYETIHIPALMRNEAEDAPLISLKQLPEWTHACFPSEMTHLNRVQSRVFPIAFESSENMLVCAPTGAGKTNVALLSMLQTIETYRDAEGRYAPFRMIYIAPMKALVQEMVQQFQQRLSCLGLSVAELSGDRQLSLRAIQSTHLLIATPEKWDIITRKHDLASLHIRLVIVDEIHLLHDDRGPVLEALIARTLKSMEISQHFMRLVGLSATLPNYQDVALFLRVPKEACFYFDASYRPCPLAQTMIGVTEKKAWKRFQLYQELVYDYVVESVQRQQQVIVFVHSRQDCVRTAKQLRDQLIARHVLLLGKEAASREIVQSEVTHLQYDPLKETLTHGIGMHHAGIPRADRTLMEDLFADRHIPVLISTATLAWGVNLPAHTVLIKGTQIYRPDLGEWTGLSPQDLLQMLGRAGRPQFDRQGHGIVLTTHAEMQFYLSLIQTQLPIESQMMQGLVQHLNAEIVRQQVTSREEAVNWMGYTYLYVRMIRAPSVYGVNKEQLALDPTLKAYRKRLAHSALTQLEKQALIQYEVKSGQVQATEWGRLTSHYYLHPSTMALYQRHFQDQHWNDSDLLRLLSMSHEFKHIPIRMEERHVLAQLLERVPIPVQESLDDAKSKVQVLFQAHISRLSLKGLALQSDSIFIQQNGTRLCRALFEWALLKKSANVVPLLQWCVMIEQQVWPTQFPLRQLNLLQENVLIKLERKELPFERYFDLQVEQLGEMMRVPALGKVLYEALRKVPRTSIQCQVVPLTRAWLQLSIQVTSQYEHDTAVHGSHCPFWLFILSESQCLYYEPFSLSNRKTEHVFSVRVPLFEPMAPCYFVHVMSDRYLVGRGERVAIALTHLSLPEKFGANTPVLDLAPLPWTATGVVNVMDENAMMNPIQTQCFHSLFETRENVIVTASETQGVNELLEFLLERELFNKTSRKCLVLVPDWLQAKSLYEKLKKKWQEIPILWNQSPWSQDENEANEMKSLFLVICTPDQFLHWSNSSRLDLVLVTSIHTLYESHLLEMALMTLRPLARRFIAYGASCATTKALGQWLKCETVFQFEPLLEQQVNLVGVKGMNREMLLEQMKEKWNAMKKKISIENENSLMIVPNKKEILNASLNEALFDYQEIDSIEIKDESSIVVFMVDDLSPSSCLHLLNFNTRITFMIPLMKKDYFKHFISHAMSVESSLLKEWDFFLCFLFSQSGACTLSRLMEPLAETFCYQRSWSNPNYYGCSRSEGEVLNEEWSEQVEQGVERLVASQCLTEAMAENGDESDEKCYELTPIGWIVVHHQVRVETVDMMQLSVQSGTKMKGLLDILASCLEWELLNYSIGDESFISSHLSTKCANFVHDRFMHHLSQSPCLTAKELRLVLKLIACLVDVCAIQAFATPLLACLSLSQRFHQSNKQHPLLQLPHATPEFVALCQENQIETVYDFMESDQKKSLLKGFTAQQVKEVAAFVNRYPNVSCQVQLERERITLGESVEMQILFDDQDSEEEEQDQTPHWWIVISLAKTLLAVKHLTRLPEQVTLSLTLPDMETGKYTIKTCLMCDRLLGCDQEWKQTLILE